MLHFNHLCGFCSSSFLSQLGLCKLLVFGKVCFDLIKHNLFFFIHFFFLLLFSHFFGVFRFFCFYQCPDNSPPKKIALPVRVRVWTSFRVRTRFGGQFSSGKIALEPFLPVEKKEIFYMPTKCSISFIYYMCKAATFCRY